MFINAEITMRYCVNKHINKEITLVLIHGTGLSLRGKLNSGAAAFSRLQSDMAMAFSS